ncbi:hypothetical protein NT6N_27410 [Oceaniferula spumae]|uniref:VCBS repeat-containing protein n=1 Tax=Oceaniferula spumae TaxID=2979115 RepID=A0AAT9FNY2_9BACT
MKDSSVGRDADKVWVDSVKLPAREEGLVAWRIEKFGDDFDEIYVSGSLADPDGDGLVNLAEYGFGLDPLAISEVPNLGISRVGSTSDLEVLVNGSAVGVGFYVMKSVDLVGWSEVDSVPSDGGAVGDKMLLKLGVLEEDGLKGFYRVGVRSE